MDKRIYIAGGSGMLGQYIEKHLDKQGYKVTVLTRSKNTQDLEYPDTPEELAEIFEGATAIINLAGASIVGKRWNPEYKEILYNSRIKTTKYLVEAINLTQNKPQIFISASAVGFYGDRAEEVLTEELNPAEGFVANICIDWEKEALKCEIPTFIPRIGIVLAKEGGALQEMITPFKFFVGGPIGSGKQWFPWIHIKDIYSIFKFAIENNLEGIYNAVAPEEVRMSTFAKKLGKVMSRPSLFQVPSFVLKIILGESAQEVLRSQRVSASKILKANYKFQYNELEDALRSMV